LQRMAVHAQFASPLRQQSSEEELETVRLSGSFMHHTSGPYKCFHAVRPDSGGRVCVDVVSIFLLLLDSVLVPYQLAWELNASLFFLWHGLFTVTFWTCDIVLSFYTAYYDADHKLIDDMRKIAHRYLRTFFILDLTVVACDWVDILHQVTGADSGRNIATVKVFRLLKLGRMIRLGANLRTGKIVNLYTQLYRMAQKHDLSELMTFTVNITKIVFLIAWINHLGGCMWYYWGKAGARNWHSWLNTSPFQQLTYDSDSYALYLYWSVTAMVSGASVMDPTSNQEIIYITFWVLFSLVFGSTLISSLAAMLMELELSNREWSKEIQLLRAYLLQNHVPMALRIIIERDVKDKMTREKRLSEADVSSLVLLSSKVRAELWVSVYGILLSRPLFMRLAIAMDKTFLRDCCQHAFGREILSSGTEIFKPETEALGAYFVKYGSLVYEHQEDASSLAESRESEIVRPEVSVAKPPLLNSDPSLMQPTQTSPIPSQQMGSGTRLGADQIHAGECFCEVALWSQWNHCGWMEVATPCELLSFGAEAFTRILSGHPEVAIPMLTYAGAFCRLANIAAETDVTFRQSDLACKVPEEDLVIHIPIECRIRMSTEPFLRLAKEVGWTSMLGEGKLLQDVATQVNEGQCDLHEQWVDVEHHGHHKLKRGSIVRTVSLVQLDLQLHPSGFSLVELGSIRKRRWRTSICKPTVGVEGGETVGEAQFRLLQKVERFADKLDISGTDVEVEVREAKSVGVVSRIRRMMIHATVDEDDLPQLESLDPAEDDGRKHVVTEPDSELSLRASMAVKPLHGETSKSLGSNTKMLSTSKSRLRSADGFGPLHQSTASLENLQTFCLSHEENGHRVHTAYAWMLNVELERLSSHHGHQLVEQWLQDHTPPELRGDFNPSFGSSEVSGEARGYAEARRDADARGDAEAWDELEAKGDEDVRGGEDGFNPSSILEC